MRLLLDTCVSGKAADELRAAGHDVEWTGDWPEDPGDEEILAHANADGRTLVTLDKDFGELAIVHRQPHCGILRVAAFSVAAHAKVVAQALVQFGAELKQGAVVTAEPGRLRIRPPESDSDENPAPLRWT